MEPVLRPAHPADEEQIMALLSRVGLPLDRLADHLSTAIVARLDGRVVGSAALEVYGESALLRSVAVDSALQGRGLGLRLTHAAIELARTRGVRALYLLTTTASNFFPKFGFQPIARADVPEEVLGSVEFTAACPATATVMRKRFSVPGTPDAPSPLG